MNCLRPEAKPHEYSIQKKYSIENYKCNFSKLSAPHYVK